MLDFLTEIRRLEWEFDEGLWAPAILDHTDQKIDFAGADYAGFDEIINGYTVQVTGIATRVDLVGSNTNFADVLIPTGVTIVSQNSAGLQRVKEGDPDDIASAVRTELTPELDDIPVTLDHARAANSQTQGLP